MRNIANCSVLNQKTFSPSGQNAHMMHFSQFLHSSTRTPLQRLQKYFNLQRLPICAYQLINFKTLHTSMSNNSDSNTVNITYIDREGDSHHIKGKVGDNVMYLAQKHDLDVEGACEASLACCTCHVYVEKFFDKLNDLEEEEEDMLDLAPFLQENSRLSCQIILNKEIDGIVVRLPSATRNFYVDGHKPKPH